MLPDFPAWSHIPRSHILRKILLIPLCLAPMLASASDNTDPTPHPCLVQRHAAPLTPTHVPHTTLTLSGSTGSKWLLDGVIPEYLTPKDLADEQHQLIKEWLHAPKTIVSAHFAKNRKADRYGRRKAFIMQTTGQQDQPKLLQEALLEAGLARLSLDQVNLDCAHHLQAFERVARLAKAGLWKSPPYRTKNAAGLHLSAIVSTYQVIQGKVTAVSRNPKGTSYLNFGKNWRQDFTVTLDKKSLAAWEAQNKSLDELRNATIYVRGWIEDRGGPLIRVRHPLQLWQQEPAKDKPNQRQRRSANRLDG